MMMILRPQGLLPERRHKMEFANTAKAPTTSSTRHRYEHDATTACRVVARQSGDARPSNITKQFGGLTAVSDVTFTLPEKSIVSIIGPNGAGKTTFFNILTGFYRPTLGSIAFAGRNITGARPTS